MKVEAIFYDVQCLLLEDGTFYRIHHQNSKILLERLKPVAENDYLEFYLVEFQSDVPDEPMMFTLLLRKEAKGCVSLVSHDKIWKNDGWKAYAVKDNLVLFPQVSTWDERELITDEALVYHAADGNRISHSFSEGRVGEGCIESKGDYLEIRTKTGTCYYMARNSHCFEQIEAHERPESYPYGWKTLEKAGLSVEDCATLNEKLKK